MATGGPATNAQISLPFDVTADAAGNLFITDGYSNRVRKVDAVGTITTVAGDGTGGSRGTAGFSGDGGPAAWAQLSGPSGVAVDTAGNLFIADGDNQRIRKVDTASTITTVAGSGNCTPQFGCGDGGFGGDGGPATYAQLSEPSGVAVDAAGNLFIADGNNQRIRKVDTAGTITTVAGGGCNAPEYGCPSGFSGDGGPATSAQLSSPSGVTVDGAGNLFIADTTNNRVRKVDTAGTITTIAGNGNDIGGSGGDGGPATGAQLTDPGGVAVDAAGNFFVADAANQRIRKVDTAGTITTVAGNGIQGFSGDGGPATSAQLNNPRGVGVDAGGNLFIVDVNNNRIRKMDAAGTITTVVGTGTAGFGGDGGPATDAQLLLVVVNCGLMGCTFPYVNPGVAVDAAGTLFVGDAGNHRVRAVDAAGTITTVAGNGTQGFSGDGGLATDAQLDYPGGLAVDRAGNLFIADTGINNHRVRKVDPAGTITTVAGNGIGGSGGDSGPATSAQLNLPSGVVVDVAGNLFIADAASNRIRKVDTGGTITTVADGCGFTYCNPGFSGDGGPATSAQLNNPRGVGVDARGNLFIADSGNNRIRKVEAFTAITPPSATATLTVTATPSPSAMPTATRTPTASATPSASATATTQPSDGGGGCMVTPHHGRGAAWWLPVAALLLVRARRRTGGLRRIASQFRRVGPGGR